MPIVDDDVIIEVEFTDGVGSSNPLSFSYLGITGLDTNRSAASQLTVLVYFTEFSDGTTVGNGTFTNWYDPYLINPTDTSGNVFLDFDDARGIVTIQNLELSTVTFADGSTTKTRKILSDDTYTKVRIMRSQNITNKSHTFQSGSRITSDSLNNAIGQVFDAAQELDDRLVRVEGATFEEGVVLNSQDFPVIPITKGGTGAATTTAAREALGTNDASNLTTGTIPNARITGLPKGNILTSANDIINKSVGTSAGNVIELDGLGRLPAVDGSQLTNLPSGGGGGSGDMTGVDITAGDGLDITQSNTTSGDYTATLSVDLKANGGLVVESTELGVDLAASNITNSLPYTKLSGTPVLTEYTSHPVDTSWKFFCDFFQVTPDLGSNDGNNQFWMMGGGSGVSPQDQVDAGARGTAQHTMGGSNRRYAYWGAMILNDDNRGDGDELVWESRVYFTDSTATTGSVSLGVVDRVNTLNRNDSPPSDGYSTFDYASIVFNLANTNVVIADKDTGTADNPTVTDLGGSFPMTSYVDGWFRVGVHCKFNNTNSNWDIDFYIDGTKVGSTISMTFDECIVPFVGISVGTHTGNCGLNIDWISYQGNIGSPISGRTSILDVDNL